MKILHTSDWHLGREFYGYDLREYQEQFLAQMLGLLREFQPDALVIAGDVLDKKNPADADVLMLSEFICAANEYCHVVIISGNHDGASRLGFLSDVLHRVGVHIVSRGSQVGIPIEIPNREGNLAGRLYPIPYLYPHQEREELSIWTDTEGNPHPDAWLEQNAAHSESEAPQHRLLPGKTGIINAAALRRIGNDILARGRTVPLIGIAHDNFTKNFTPPEDEVGKYTVGSLPNVDNTVLATLGGMVSGNQGLDYFALGHIHKCYPVIKSSGFEAWYSGSPLPYATDDTNDKYVLAVEINPAHEVTVEKIPLSMPYQVCEFNDSFENLLNLGNPKYAGLHDAFCQITLTENYTPENALQRIKSIFPRMTRLQTSSKTGGTAKWVTEAVSPLEFTKTFLKNAQCSEEAILLVETIYEELVKGGSK